MTLNIWLGIVIFVVVCAIVILLFVAQNSSQSIQPFQLMQPFQSMQQSYYPTQVTRSDQSTRTLQRSNQSMVPLPKMDQISRRIRQNPIFQSSQSTQMDATDQITLPTTAAQISPIPSETNVWESEHNRIRNDVNQNSIRWNDTIAQGAKNYATKCIFDHSKKSDRKFGNDTLGENLAMGSPYDYYDETKMMGLWEDEKNLYTHPQTPNSDTGHYTQIINKNVTEFGCGCANCNDTRFCVCRYDPIQLGNQAPY